MVGADEGDEMPAIIRDIQHHMIARGHQPIHFIQVQRRLKCAIGNEDGNTLARFVHQVHVAACAAGVQPGAKAHALLPEECLRLFSRRVVPNEGVEGHVQPQLVQVEGLARAGGADCFVVAVAKNGLRAWLGKCRHINHHIVRNATEDEYALHDVRRLS